MQLDYDLTYEQKKKKNSGWLGLGLVGLVVLDASVSATWAVKNKGRCDSVNGNTKC